MKLTLRSAAGWLPLLIVAIGLSACGGSSGGGGGGSGGPPPPPATPPPSGLSYASPQSYNVGAAITPLDPTVTGTVRSYGVSPALPAGLSLDTTTGRISGTPTEPSRGTHTITATNAGGTSAPASSTVVVDTAAPVIQPGIEISTDVGGCTASFVYDGGGKTYIGTAAHCVDPALVPGAVEEILRFTSITHQGRRRATTADTEIAGCPISAGQGVIVSNEAANRDPEVFENPTQETLDRIFVLKRDVATFTLASGRQSTYYCDGKQVSFSGEGLSLITHAVETAATTKRNETSRRFSQEAWRLLESAFEATLNHEPGTLNPQSQIKSQKSQMTFTGASSHSHFSHFDHQRFLLTVSR